jgi:hypothetical protein
VSGTSELLLGIIALSVLVMAAIQVGALIAGWRLAKRIEALSRQLEQDIKPVIGHLTTLTSEAARTAALASRQVERVDQLFGEMAARVDDTLTAAQRFVQGPARSGMAILSGVHAAVSALQSLREASRRRQSVRRTADDEESLFIG